MALEASSSHDMQLAGQIESIKMRTDKLSLEEDPCQIVTEKHDQFINKAKQQINYFTQLLREILNGSLKKETVASLDVEILDIHWDRRAKDTSLFAKDASRVARDASLRAEDIKYAKDMKELYGLDVIIREDVYLDIDDVELIPPTLEEEMLKLIHKSFVRVDQLLMSDEHFSLHDDLKALQEEQMKWFLLELNGQIPISGYNSSPESGSDSEHEGISDPMLGFVN